MLNETLVSKILFYFLLNTHNIFLIIQNTHINIPLKYTPSYVILGGAFLSTEFTWVKKKNPIGIMKAAIYVKKDE